MEKCKPKNGRSNGREVGTKPVLGEKEEKEAGARRAWRS
jgi:hypothetical protein